MSTQTKRNTYQRGMTLVEVMIAMVLGLLLTAGILQLFVSNKQTYRTTESIARLQENARFAMFFLTKDIRMADFWGCRGHATSIDNNLKPHATYDPFGSGLEGSDNDSTDPDIIDDTDTLIVRSALGLNVSVIEPRTSLEASIRVTDDSGLAKNDIVLISNCTDGDIFQITNDPSVGGPADKDELEHAIGTILDDPGNRDDPSINNRVDTMGDGLNHLRTLYNTDAQVYRLNFSKYYIGSSVNGGAALFREINGGTAQELVEGIENMQILYGEDTTADGIPNFYKISSSVDMNNVVAVRISLVAVTADDNLTDQVRNYFIFGSSITPSDNRVRRVFTSTIVIRNRVP